MPKQGLWTPWSKVLCYDCHGPKFASKTLDETALAIVNDEDQPLDEEHAVTTCELCGCEVQVRDDVAYERNIVASMLKAGIQAEMWQTGGMCAAAAILCENDEYIMVTWDADGYWVCRYDSEGGMVQNDTETIIQTHDEVITYIASLEGLRRVETI